MQDLCVNYTERVSFTKFGDDNYIVTFIDMSKFRNTNVFRILSVRQITRLYSDSNLMVGS